MESRGIVETLSPGHYRVELSPAFYEREAVFAACQRLNDVFFIKIAPLGAQSCEILLQCKEGREGEDHGKLAHELLNDIIEEQVRLDLAKRTGALREILYRHAFLPLEENEKRA